MNPDPITNEIMEILSTATINVPFGGAVRHVDINITEADIMRSQVRAIKNLINRERSIHYMDLINEFVNFCKTKDLTFSPGFNIKIEKLAEPPIVSLARQSESFKGLLARGEHS